MMMQLHLVQIIYLKVHAINANGEFSWTPDENQVGTFVFTVKVSDGTDSAQTSASVTVKAFPPPPPPNHQI